ncbi:MAG: hypothetical protein D6731_20460 [Planctomycetota bacterium]|nr:MAG: hypothetical protein D6731_20460 [Planctomycetota bacterium]
MNPDCARLRAAGAALVRGDLDGKALDHLDACPACRRLLQGARALRADLDAWRCPPPPPRLVDDALACLALAGGGAGGSFPPERSRRRSSVDSLTTLLPGGGERAKSSSRAGPWLRLCAQGAAAALLFVLCCAFVAVFYPAVTYALEERRLEACRERLARLARAALRYRAAHPTGDALHGAELRAALLEGGYAQPEDFVCPGAEGKRLGARSYVGRLPAGSSPLPGDAVLFLDRFANHSGGCNLATADGRTRTLTPEALSRWRLPGLTARSAALPLLPRAPAALPGGARGD